jgi:hypothetical protein
MASTADLADLADRFEVSGPARILYRATAGHPSTTMIDWYAILCIMHGILNSRHGYMYVIKLQAILYSTIHSCPLEAA